MIKSTWSQKEEFPTGELGGRTQLRRARETESALDSLKKLQDSACLGRHRGTGAWVPLCSRGDSRSHLKCLKWEISGLVFSSFLLKPRGFHELAAFLEHQQTCQDGSSSATGQQGVKHDTVAWLALVAPRDKQASAPLCWGYGE